jgi:hypothetical protein
LVTVLLLLTATVLALVPGVATAEDIVLTVGRTKASFTVDGKADETAWAVAPPTIVETKKGDATLNVEVKALYDDTYIYFLTKWSDPSYSVTPNQWNFSGGAWQSYLHKEDRLSMLWDSGNIAGFETQRQGCAALECHEGAFQTKTAGEWGDVWQWLAGRTNPNTRADNMGWMDDLSVGVNGIAPDDFSGSKVWVPNSFYAGDSNVSTVQFATGDHPVYKAQDNNPPPNPDPNILFDGYVMNIVNPLEFTDGTTLPGWVLGRPTGDRADIDAKGLYDSVEKIWTLEVKRKLVTGHTDDVQFADLTKDYSMGLSVFDNREGGVDTHYNSQLVTVRFALPELAVTAFTTSTASPVIGGRVTVNVTLRNVGAYATGFTVGLYIDNTSTTPVLTKPYSEMAANSNDTFNWSWDTTGVEAGKHKLIVKADTAGIIVEKDKTNNIKDLEVWVYPGISELKASKTKPEAGTKVTVTATVHNPSTTTVSLTIILSEGEKVLDTKIENITGGQFKNVTFTWKSSKVGKHTLTVMVQGSPETTKTIVINVQKGSPAPGAVWALVALGAVAAAAIASRRRK